MPRVVLGEGETPTIELPRLADALGVGALHTKLEHLNPTGSYKDRIAARSMELARERGNGGWIATSSGNAATSFAAYGQRAGIPGFLCVQPNIPREKLLPALACGARVVKIEGVGAGATPGGQQRLFDVVADVAAEHGLYLGVTAHAFNDAGMRAVDAIAGEVLDAGVEPDVAYVPTGGGGLVAAIARGFAERGARTAVVAAQPSACGPIARHLLGELDAPVIATNESAISGLQLPSPPDGELAAELIRRTDGWGVLADDAEILLAQGMLAATEGVFAEPAAAAGLAGLLADVHTGRVGADDHILLVITGSGLKDLTAVERATEPPQLVGPAEVPGLVDEWVSAATSRAG